MAENDFQYWLEGAPVVTINSDPLFGGWDEGCVVLDGLGSSGPGPGSLRRRVAFIF